MFHPMFLLMYVGWFITAFVSVNTGLDAFGYTLVHFSRPMKMVIGLAGLFSFFMFFSMVFGPKERMFQQQGSALIEIENPVSDFSVVELD